MMSNENNKSNLFRVKSKNGVLRFFKAGVDINTCNDKVQTALFTCNVPEAVQAMIDADIDIHHLDNDGNNALFYAQNVEKVELLVSNGINVNHRNKSGTLAIQHIDVSPGLAKYLIKAGLDIHTKISRCILCPSVSLKGLSVGFVVRMLISVSAISRYLRCWYQNQSNRRYHQLCHHSLVYVERSE